MPILARKIDKPLLWADLEEDWNDGDFPFEILAELKDGRDGNRGLSTFECAGPNDPMLNRIAAALYIGTDQKNSPEKTIFRFVSTDELASLGIRYEKTPGDTKDTDVNNLHYDIKGLNGPRALALAVLFGQSEAKAIKQPDIITSITEGLRLGRHKNVDAKEKCLAAINTRNGIQFSETSLVFPAT